MALPQGADPGRIQQAVLDLIDPASPDIEAALAAYIQSEGFSSAYDACPAHPYTTLDGGDCGMCRLDQLGEARFPAPASGWVARAAEGRLPVKSYIR